ALLHLGRPPWTHTSKSGLDSSTGGEGPRVSDLAEKSPSVLLWRPAGDAAIIRGPFSTGRQPPAALYSTGSENGQLYHQRDPLGSQGSARRRPLRGRRERVRQARQGPGVQPHQGTQPEDRPHDRAHLQV